MVFTTRYSTGDLRGGIRLINDGHAQPCVELTDIERIPGHFNPHICFHLRFLYVDFDFADANSDGQL